MKKHIFLANILVLLSFLSTPAINAAIKVNYGKKVDWVNITADNNWAINSGILLFSSKKKDTPLLQGLDKRVKYIGIDYRDNSKQKLHPVASEVSTEEGIGSSIEFSAKQNTQTIYAIIVFYDKNKKPIAYQDKTLNVQKLVINQNKQIKKLNNDRFFEIDKATKTINVDLSKLEGKFSYWTFHYDLKPVSLAAAIKEGLAGTRNDGSHGSVEPITFQLSEAAFK
ncbi:hypothetical protein [Peribacillus sp. SCS-155]|uniref:hypothetical protein n=1 Tax=Peribacillus sedimenti TaxID=3115297 RepID=UPI00390650BE